MNAITTSNNLTIEKGFSPLKYLVVAVVIGAVAGAIFTTCLPLAIALLAVSGWFLYSASIVVLNRNVNSKPIQWLHSLMTELHAGTKAAMRVPFTWSKSYYEPKGKAEGTPILMLNGYLDPGTGLHSLTTSLLEKGRGPIYTIHIGSFRSIKTYADQVAKKVNEIGAKEIILICHSKGGLVGSLYALENTHIEVSKLITIGSPLNGTPLAILGPGLDAREMQPESEIIQKIQQGIGSLNMYNIASATDEVVPLESALAGNDETKQFTVKDMGHLALCSSTRVADQIDTWLTQ